MSGQDLFQNDLHYSDESAAAPDLRRLQTEVFGLRVTCRRMAETIVDGVIFCRLELEGDVEVLDIKRDGDIIRARVLQQLPGATTYREHALVIVPDSDGYDVNKHEQRELQERPA